MPPSLPPLLVGFFLGVFATIVVVLLCIQDNQP